MDKKKIKRFIMKNQMNIAIGGISFLALIIGIFAIGFLKSFFIVGIIDICLFAPTIWKIIKKKAKKPNRAKTTANTNKTKINVNKANNSKKVEKKTKEKKKKRKKGIAKKIFIGIFILCILLGIAGCIAAGLFFMQIAKNAPKFDPNQLDRKEASVFYNVHGNEIAKVGAQKREKITYDQMSENLINAIIATEDSRFFTHNGFDLPRFLKASVNQLLGRGGGGASTLTMQVSKNNYTSTESRGWEGIKRKFTDIYMAMYQLEKTYTKKEIIEFYVNDNYLGGSSYGVEQASLTYFSKHAKDLNLAEAAMIAGLFQSPAGYDPFLNPEACEKRRQTVLYLMERHGYITAEEKEIASSMTVEKILNPFTETSDTGNEYMSFINLVISEIQKDLNLDPYTTPMKIYTTLDPDKQDEINKILTGETFNWQNPAVDAGVAVVDNQTGAISAISGGRHNMYDIKVLNYAVETHQIGSTAKPLFDYGPAIEYLNWSTKQLIVDDEHGYSSGGTVNNWDLKYMGMMTVQEALRLSRNIPAIKTFQTLDNKDIQKFVSNLHLSPETSDGIIHEAHSIGGYDGESPITLAAAYSAFANGGYYITPHSYTKIELRESGEVHNKKVEKTRAMSEETAYMVTHMLLETPSYALGSYSNIPGVTYGAKTGTTNYPDSAFKIHKLPNGAINDYWVVGSSPNYTISLWYGYGGGIKPENVQAGYINKLGQYHHLRLFQTLGKALFEKGTKFTKPNGVIEIEIEKDSYPLALPSENTPSDMITTALFKKGTEPTEQSTRFSSLTNISNLKGGAVGNKVTLSWDGISTPSYMTAEGIREIYKDLFKKEEYLIDYINSQLNYNNSAIGQLEYHVYRKNADGSLTLMAKTSSNEVTFTDTSAGKNTYIIKSSYSILTKAASSGVEIVLSVEDNSQPEEKPDDDKDKNDISILVNGSKNIKISETNQFDESGYSYVMVTERINGVLTDVTDKATIEVSHDTFDYTKPGTTYKATLKVSYKKQNRTIELNITIE